MECPVCGTLLPLDERSNLHVEAHFSSASHSTTSAASTYSIDDLSTSQGACASNLSNDSGRLGFAKSRALFGATGSSSTSRMMSGGWDLDHAAAAAAMEASDAAMARQLQREEDARLAAREAEQLREMYGLTGVSSDQQLQRALDNAVERGSMGVADVYEIQRLKRSANRVGYDDGLSRTPGLAPALQAWYSKQRFTVSEDSITNVLWCRPTADQFSSHLEDRGWGCGYRNLQMLLSSMCREPAFLALVFNGVPQVPSVRKLQQLIEDAWSAGFDPVGRDQLGGRLVNTRKWIGTTEAFAVLSYLRVRCRVYDFRRPTGPGGTHVALFEAVKAYYRGRETECSFPLYLQHEGHSRTIVGMEMRRNGDNRLLIFDPAWRPNTVASWCRKPSSALASVRCRLTDLRQAEYQLLCVTGTLGSDNDWIRAKSMRGALVRVPSNEK